MGLKKWLARRGNIGGIARNIAKWWNNFRENRPDASPREIAISYVIVRIGMISGDYVEAVINKIESEDIKTTIDLAWTVLMLENINDQDIILKNRHEWTDIMREEMIKNGLDPDLRI